MWNEILSYHFIFDIVTAVNICMYTVLFCSGTMNFGKSLIPPSSAYQESDTSLFSVPRV